MNAKRISQLWAASAAAMTVLHGAAVAAPFLTIPLHVRNVTTTAAEISWEWNIPSPAKVVFGLSTNYGDTIAGGPSMASAVRLTSLRPGTRYYYNVIADGAMVAKEGPTHFFFTAPNDFKESFVAAVIGDTRTGEESYDSDHAAVIESIVHNSAPVLLLHLGDMVDNSEKNCWEHFYAIEAPLLKNCTLVPCRGNSDGSAGEFVERFRPAGGKPWYAYVFGGLRFIILDIQNKKTPEIYAAAIGPQSEQYRWLEHALADGAAKAPPFTIVAFFAPLFGDNNEGSRYLQKTLCPLFERGGVDLVVNAGAHYFSYGLQNGIPYMVSGGGGANRESEPACNGTTIRFSRSTFHHLRIMVHYPAITVDAIDNGGTIFYSLPIIAAAEKTLPPSFLAFDGASPFTLTLFGTPDCDECRTIKQEIFPRLRQHFTAWPLKLDFYNIEKEANFAAYRELESRLGGEQHQFPVVKIGDRLISGRLLTYQHLDSIVNVIADKYTRTKKSKARRQAAIIAGGIATVGLAAALILIGIRKRRKGV